MIYVAKEEVGVNKIEKLDKIYQTDKTNNNASMWIKYA